MFLCVCVCLLTVNKVKPIKQHVTSDPCEQPITASFAATFSVKSESQDETKDSQY